MRAIALAIIIGAFMIKDELAKLAGKLRDDEARDRFWHFLWGFLLLLLILGW